MSSRARARYSNTVLGQQSSITPALTPSRISGVAPLYVNFDATGTTSSDPTHTSLTNGGTYRQVTHSYNYGDSGAGNWTYFANGGSSKNTKVGGPLGNHLYESPGTFFVTDTCSASGTTSVSGFATITVQDPDVVFAGTATVCINGTGTNDGAGPSGCSYVASFPGTNASNKRYLFKRGGTFGAFDVTGTQVRVGTYGSGAKPIITSDVTIGNGGSGTDTGSRDIVVQDLSIQGNLNIQRGQHLVGLRCDSASGPGDGFYFDESAPYAYMKYHALIDCTCNDPTKATTIAAAYGVLSFSWIAGLYVQAIWQHEIRMLNSYKLSIENCRLPYNDGYGGVGHSIKLHAYGTGSSSTPWDESSTATNLLTCYNEINNNVMHDPTSDGNWTVAVTPQNSTAGEAVSDVIVGNNGFYRGTSGSSTDIVMGGRRITYRGNTMLTNGQSMIYGTSVDNPPSGFDGPYFSN